MSHHPPRYIPALAAGRTLGLSDQAVWRRVRNGNFPTVYHLIDRATGCLAAHVLLDDFEMSYGPIDAACLAKALERSPAKARKWPTKYSKRQLDSELLARDAQWCQFLRIRFDYDGPYPPNLQGE
jgi:predicted DNA-binding transcriptional regulator AlpA